MIDYKVCAQCKTAQDARFGYCLRCGGKMMAFSGGLAEMDTEEFLVWLLENCKLGEPDFAEVRARVQDFILSRLVYAAFDMASVERNYPHLVAWLSRTAKSSLHVHDGV